MPTLSIYDSLRRRPTFALGSSPASWPMLGTVWAALALGSALLPACAGQDDDFAGEETSLLVPAHAVVGTPAAGASDTQTTSPTTSSDYNSLTKPSASVATGISVRWANDNTRCLARANSSLALGTPILLEPCAAAQEQTWVIVSGSISPDGITCAGLSGNVNLVLVPCADGNVDWSFNGGSTRLNISYSAGIFVLQPYDAIGTYGLPVQANSMNFGSTITYWNLYGVGTSRGALVSFLGDPRYCLTQKNSTVSTSACNASDLSQQWNLIKGDLANSSNQCVVCDMNTRVISMLDCALVSNSGTNNQGWFVGGSAGLSYATGDAGGVRYSLDWNANSGRMGLAPTTNGNYWIFGGHR